MNLSFGLESLAILTVYAVLLLFVLIGLYAFSLVAVRKIVGWISAKSVAMERQRVKKQAKIKLQQVTQIAAEREDALAKGANGVLQIFLQHNETAAANQMQLIMNLTAMLAINNNQHSKANITVPTTHSESSKKLPAPDKSELRPRSKGLLGLVKSTFGFFC